MFGWQRFCFWNLSASKNSEPLISSHSILIKTSHHHPLPHYYKRFMCTGFLHPVEDGAPNGLELLRLLDRCPPPPSPPICFFSGGWCTKWAGAVGQVPSLHHYAPPYLGFLVAVADGAPSRLELRKPLSLSTDQPRLVYLSQSPHTGGGGGGGGGVSGGWWTEQAGTAETVAPVALPPLSADWSRLECLSQSPRACCFQWRTVDRAGWNCWGCWTSATWARRDAPPPASAPPPLCWSARACCPWQHGSGWVPCSRPCTATPRAPAVRAMHRLNRMLR